MSGRASLHGGPLGRARLASHVGVTPTRRRLWLTTALIVAAPLLAWIWWQPSVYEARARLVLEPLSPVHALTAAAHPSVPHADLDTVRQQLSVGDRPARKTVTALELWKYSEFTRPTLRSITTRLREWAEPYRPGWTPPAVYGTKLPPKDPAYDDRAEPVLARFRERVDASQAESGPVILVRARAESAQLAADIANRLADEVIREDLEQRFDVMLQRTRPSGASPRPLRVSSVRVLEPAHVPREPLGTTNALRQAVVVLALAVVVATLAVFARDRRERVIR